MKKSQLETLIREVLKETIRKVDGKYVVYPEKGGKRLGTHSTKAAAEKQLTAIHLNKEGTGGADTSWIGADDEKITLQDILDLTKNIKVVNYPTQKLAKVVLDWDNNPEEIERISQVTVSSQYPILIMVDEQNKIQWILDGNHRAQKALRSKAETIPAKLIKPSDLNAKAKKILLGITEASDHLNKEAVEPNFDFEWKEATRYPEFKKLGKDKWIELAKTGKAITITSAKDINNTDANEPNAFKTLNPDKQKRALAQLKSGNIEMPIVALYSDGYKELIGGNTRLTAMMAQNKKATIWQFEVPEEIDENYADGKVKGKSRPGRVKRSGASCKGSVTDLRAKAKKYGGEKGKMYHWCANMKSGRKKK